MPGLYKIGFTTKSVEERAKQLYTTGVPTPFQIEISVEVNDPHLTEKKVHERFDRYRYEKKREFFQVPLALVQQEFAAIASLPTTAYHTHIPVITPPLYTPITHQEPIPLPVSATTPPSASTICKKVIFPLIIIIAVIVVIIALL